MTKLSSAVAELTSAPKVGPPDVGLQLTGVLAADGPTWYVALKE